MLTQYLIRLTAEERKLLIELIEFYQLEQSFASPPVEGDHWYQVKALNNKIEHAEVRVK